MRPRRCRSAPLLAVALAVALAACGGPEVPPAPQVEDTVEPRLTLGVFVPGGVWQDQGTLRALEAAVGQRFAIVHWFTSWDHPYEAAPVEAVLAAGQTPLISWQPHGQTVREIAAGEHDAYVRAWARAVREAPGAVYLRPFPEMNGDWVPWNGDPEGLRAAWTHLTTLFDQEGATNVRWVWSPNVTDEPRTDANRMENYYPGADHVDVLALSGYNWGDTRPYIGWRSFDDIVGQAYPRLAALGDQPIWIAETASSEEGGDKADWIRDMFRSERFARLEAVVWFNMDKEADWRIESSPEALAAFRDGLANRLP